MKRELREYEMCVCVYEPIFFQYNRFFIILMLLYVYKAFERGYLMQKNIILFFEESHYSTILNIYIQDSAPTSSSNSISSTWPTDRTSFILSIQCGMYQFYWNIYFTKYIHILHLYNQLGHGKHIFSKRLNIILAGYLG